MLIVLVGMPASGKSTLGKLISSKLHFDFIDLDELICQREGCSIPDIFDKGGEVLFRQTEQEALHSILDKKRLVLSTGGGTPCFFDNMDQINQKGLSIYIQLPLETIADRILADKNNIRPLYKDKSREELIVNLESLYKIRSVFYEKAYLYL